MNINESELKAIMLKKFQNGSIPLKNGPDKNKYFSEIG